MKILITGGDGYIGNSLYNSFKDAPISETQYVFEVTKIARHQVDLTDRHQVDCFFKDKHFDVLIHCAVKGGSRLKKDDISILDANLQMYYNLLANKDHYTSFINFGSGAETHNPRSPYGKSKDIISHSIQSKPDFYNIIIYAVFDENELNTRFIKSSIKKYLNKEITLPKDVSLMVIAPTKVPMHAGSMNAKILKDTQLEAQTFTRELIKSYINHKLTS